MPKNTHDYTIILAILAGIAAQSSTSMAAEKAQNPAAEKCYGIVKSGMNDCAGNNHPCQGQSSKEGDPGEFIYVLEGTCQKIIGGKKKE